MVIIWRLINSPGRNDLFLLTLPAQGGQESVWIQCRGGNHSHYRGWNPHCVLHKKGFGSCGLSELFKCQETCLRHKTTEKMCEARAVIHLFKISLCEGFPDRRAAGTRLRLDVRVCWAHTACDLDIGDLAPTVSFHCTDNRSQTR